MTISKQTIIARLRERGQDARADWVAKTLPDEVDPVKHSSLLGTLRLNIDDLMADQDGGSSATSR
jgi:hypothetical protein